MDQAPNGKITSAHIALSRVLSHSPTGMRLGNVIYLSAHEDTSEVSLLLQEEQNHSGEC